jgi:hypothetical protein
LLSLLQRPTRPYESLDFPSVLPKKNRTYLRASWVVSHNYTANNSQITSVIAPNQAWGASS